MNLNELEIYNELTEIPYESASQFVEACRRKFETDCSEKDKLVNEHFKVALAIVFMKEGLVPCYIKSKINMLPNVQFDFLFYSNVKGLVCVCADKSIAKSYKQADLEAIALKYVHRKALSFLVTLDAKEAKSVRGKIKSGDVIGLDRVVLANSSEFDELVLELKQFVFSEPPTVKVIESNQVITKEKSESLHLLSNK